MPVVSWQQWGMKSTRCLRISDMSDSAISGWRVAAADRIYDFNPLDIARDRCRAAALELAGKADTRRIMGGVVMESSVVEAGHTFLNDVVTGLPYRESRLKTAVNGKQVRILDDELVIAQVCRKSLRRSLAFKPSRGLASR